MARCRGCRPARGARAGTSAVRRPAGRCGRGRRSAAARTARAAGGRRPAPRGRRSSRHGGRGRGRRRCGPRSRRCTPARSGRPWLRGSSSCRRRRARCRARSPAPPAGWWRPRSGRRPPARPVRPRRRPRSGAGRARPARPARGSPGSGDDPGVGADGSQQLAELGDVRPDRRARPVRRLAVPQAVRQAIGGDHPVGVDEEDREDRTEPLRADGGHAVRGAHLQWSQHSELHASPRSDDALRSLPEHASKTEGGQQDIGHPLSVLNCTFSPKVCPMTQTTQVQLGRNG